MTSQSDAVPDVWVLGQRFRVIPDEMHADGMLYRPEGEIRYSKHFRGDPLRELVLHEIVHAIDYALAPVDHFGGPAGVVVDAEPGRAVVMSEDVVRRWSNGFFVCISDPRNAAFWSWMRDAGAP